MFIVIETFGGVAYAHILMDENGWNLIFDTKPQAEAYAAENCQRGIVLDWTQIGD